MTNPKYRGPTVPISPGVAAAASSFSTTSGVTPASARGPPKAAARPVELRAAWTGRSPTVKRCRAPRFAARVNRVSRSWFIPTV